MSKVFLTTPYLSNDLRKPYREGDMVLTMEYLMAGLKIGVHRVLLKRNFETACWVPPLGSRESHTIYYGDRMLEGTLRFLYSNNAIELPSQAEMEDLAAKVKAGPFKELEAFGRLSEGAQKLELMLRFYKEKATPDQWAKALKVFEIAVKAIGRHERSHARHTPINLAQVSKDLKTFGLTFFLFNVFEDARIEEISRKEIGRPFEWLEFNSLLEPKSPEAIFLRKVMLEGAVDEEALDCHDLCGAGPLTVAAIAESVESYYARVVACPTAEHMYPIMLEFVKEFEDYMTPPFSGKGLGGGGGVGSSGTGEDDDDDGKPTEAGSEAPDLSTALDAAEKGDDFFDEFEEDAEIVGGTDEEGKAAEREASENVKSGGDTDNTTIKGKENLDPTGSVEPQASGGEAYPEAFLSSSIGRIDNVYRARVDDITRRLARMFKGRNFNTVVESPGKRLSSRHLARGEVRYVKPTHSGGKSKRKYVIVYDCSGSMRGSPDREGKVLLLALNNLAKQGYLEGQLILSGWVNSAPGWLRYDFPVSEEIILSISPTHGAEGLNSAVQDNMRYIREADDLFVYTDAQICDSPMNRAELATRKVRPVGLYVGSTNIDCMLLHFPQNIIRDSIEDVVDGMLIRNKRHSR